MELGNMKNMIHVARQRLFTGKTDFPKITERQPVIIIIPALIAELGNPHEAINAQTTTSPPIDKYVNSTLMLLSNKNGMQLTSPT